MKDYKKVFDGSKWTIEKSAIIIYKELLGCKVNEGIRLKFNDETYTFKRIS